LRGSAVNVADILRLEEAAQAGLAALPTAQVRRIEVELIESRFENQADPESV
jgi:hypothetical protein